MTAPASLNTPLRMVKQALADSGRLQIGETPNGEVLADALGRLSDLIGALQTQGIKLWLNQLQSVTLVAGTSTYTFGPGGSLLTVKPMRVVEGWYRDAQNAQRPLTPLSWNEYQGLGNLTTQGAVSSYFVDKQASNLVVKFWQVPDAVAALGTAQLLLQVQATAPTSLTEAISFPTEWYLALRWALADELATGQAPAIMDRCAGKAAMYRRMLEDWDVEDASTKFQVNTQGMAPSRFSR
jgi:hypothetical protein